MHELSLHILDIMLNSVEAQASFIELQVEEDSLQDIFSITIKDNGRGMDKETLSRACSPFFSTRKTRKIGLGLSLLKAKAEECGGYLLVEGEKHKGTMVRAVFQYSHWDRPPLGNIAGSICCFLATEKPIDLLYTHRIKEKIFILDTKEIKKRIEPLSLNCTQVLKWIEEYIDSGLRDLREK